MKKSFEARVIRDRMVDTRLFRWIAVEAHDSAAQWLEIKRIPLSCLDTVRALDAWETVKVIRDERG